LLPACYQPNAIQSYQAAINGTKITSFNYLIYKRLSVSSQGLYDTANSIMLAWSNVESIKINEAGLVRIKRRWQKGDWASFQLGQLANVATLRRLLEADAPRTFAFQNQARIA